MIEHGISEGWLRPASRLRQGPARRAIAPRNIADVLDAEIAENDEIADRELAAWENERKLLAG